MSDININATPEQLEFRRRLTMLDNVTVLTNRIFHDEVVGQAEKIEKEFFPGKEAKIIIHDQDLVELVNELDEDALHALNCGLQELSDAAELYVELVVDTQYMVLYLWYRIEDNTSLDFDEKEEAEENVEAVAKPLAMAAAG